MRGRFVESIPHNMYVYMYSVCVCVCIHMLMPVRVCVYKCVCVYIRLLLFIIGYLFAAECICLSVCVCVCCLLSFRNSETVVSKLLRSLHPVMHFSWRIGDMSELLGLSKLQAGPCCDRQLDSWKWMYIGMDWGLEVKAK